MSDHASQTLQPLATSASSARTFVRDTLRGWGAGDLVDDAVLLTNELVTNAVVHAGTDVQVVCALGRGYVEIGVTDRHGSRSVPSVITNSAPDKTSGRGLYLLSRLSHIWGVEYEHESKRVWFRLLLPPADAALAPAAPGPAHSVDLGEQDVPVSVAVVESDASGRVVHWNADAERLLGWTAEQVRGRPFADLVAAAPSPPQQAPVTTASDGAAGPDSTEPGAAAEVLARPRWSGDLLMRTAADAAVPLFASRMQVTAGGHPRVVTVLVPAQQRAVLMPGGPAAGGGQEPPTPVPSRADQLPLAVLLDLAVEHSRDLIGGDVGYALLVSDDDLDVELRASSGLDEAATRQTRWTKPPELAGDPAATRPSVHADVAAEAMPERFLAESGMRALVTAPLVVGDRVIGRVGVAVARPDAFTVDDAVRLHRSISRFSLAVESARLTELEHARRDRLSYLAEASDLLAGMLDPDMAAALAAQLIVPRLADWCAVYLTDARAVPRLSCVWHATEERIDALRRLLHRVPPPPLAPTDRPRTWPELQRLLAAEASSPADVEVAGGTHVVTTLLARGRAIGTMIVGRAAGEFRPDDLDTLDDLCRRASWALDNARHYQERSSISAALQRSLLPVTLPAVPGLEVGIAYEAAGAGLDVGGDFYDLFAIDDERWGFAVGDVCGKGAEAAAVTGLARHTLRVLARENKDVPGVLNRLNETILAEGDEARFVTLVYGELTRSASALEVTFASAGHPLPILVDADGALRPVGEPQDLLGVFSEPRFRADRVRVRRGQHLVCTTDGVTDRRTAGHLLGEAGLHDLLRQTSFLPASAIASRIHQSVIEFGTEPLQDDFAVLVLQPVSR